MQIFKQTTRVCKIQITLLLLLLLLFLRLSPQQHMVPQPHFCYAPPSIFLSWLCTPGYDQRPFRHKDDHSAIIH